jgi:WD40 repeat protein
MQLTKHWAAQLDDYVIDLAWSPDGAVLAAASGAGPVRLLEAGGGAAIHELAGHAAGTNALGWNPVEGASLLATGGQDGTVKFWDGGAG